MEEIKLTLEMVRVKMGISKREMADKLDISLDRYNRLASGESKLLATEWSKIHEVSGIPYDNLATINY